MYILFLDIMLLYMIDLTFICTAAAAKSLQLCPTLCDPINGSPPGSPVPGILQARTLEWVAIGNQKIIVAYILWQPRIKPTVLLRYVICKLNL